MAKLILHVGPGKCGSSSIQHFLAVNVPRMGRGVSYTHLPPRFVRWMREHEGARAHAGLDELLQVRNGNLSVHTTILSHEVLFQRPAILRRVVEHAQAHYSDIRVIGYCRRQSTFIRSAYGQWLFRSRKRVAEVLETVATLDVDPRLFSGVERQFIAGVLDDFHSARQLSDISIHDWYAGYAAIEAALPVTPEAIRCGVLPRSGDDVSLPRDFALKAGLDATNTDTPGVKARSNRSFHPQLVEAVNMALIDGHSVPGPHKGNRELQLISREMPAQPDGNGDFLKLLSEYADGFFLEANLRLCRRFSLDVNYFSVNSRIAKDAMIEEILRVAAQRGSDPGFASGRARAISSSLLLAALGTGEE